MQFRNTGTSLLLSIIMFANCRCYSNPILVTKRRSPSGSAVRNHGRAHPAPCIRPHCVCSVFAYACTVPPGLIRRTPSPTFSDTAITDRHSGTTIFRLRTHWKRISWSIGSENLFEHMTPVGVEPSTSARNNTEQRRNNETCTF